MTGLPGFFYRYLSARMLVRTAYNAFIIYFLWEIVYTHNSVFLAGLVATIALAADLLAAIPIGHLIDRYNSTKLSMASALLLLAGVGALFFGRNLPLVYASTCFVSVGSMMMGDTISATIKKHLTREQFTAANQGIQGTTYSSTLVGTALGGASIVYFRNQFASVLLALAIASALLSYPIHEETRRSEKGDGLSEVTESLGFIKKISGFLAVGFVLNGLFVSLDVYSSGLFHIILKASPLYYTAFTVSLPVGGIVGTLLMGKIRGHVDSARRISLLILLFSPAILLVALSRSPVVDIVDALLVGALVPIVNIPLQVKLMEVVPKSIFGKIMAFLKVFLGGATPGMAAVFSFIAIYAQVNRILLYTGIIVLPVSGLAFLVLPKFMSMESGETGG